jgi:phospholipid/cholesterol/gamma-HCH transport system permease protein
MQQETFYMEPIHEQIGFNQIGAGMVNLELTGAWQRTVSLPIAKDVLSHLSSLSSVQKISFDTRGLTGWDSTLLVFLAKVIVACQTKGLAVDQSGLPQGVQRLLTLAAAVPEKKGTRSKPERPSFFGHLGDQTIDFLISVSELFAFIGEALLAMVRFYSGKARYRSVDLYTTIQECGAEALPIVSLISLLVGLILAFVGAIQLKMFGAEIYVADLVGIAMVRVMGAVMTGIIMAGRTGAAFAAQIGTMEVNEEIDALRTLGVNPVEFLVLPRMLGLTIMMPLLCLYADFMGILGGMIVGVGMLDINAAQYFMETSNAVSLTDMWIGLFQGTVFGILVALTGCLRGMQCGRSAAAVGEASTSAVVTGIVSIVVTTALVTMICSVVGI